MSKKRSAFGILRILVLTALFVTASIAAMSAIAVEPSHSNGCRKAEIYYLSTGFAALSETHSNGCSTVNAYKIATPK